MSNVMPAEIAIEPRQPRRLEKKKNNSGIRDRLVAPVTEQAAVGASHLRANGRL
jgi:hypothetical protein